MTVTFRRWIFTLAFLISVAAEPIAIPALQAAQGDPHPFVVNSRGEQADPGCQTATLVSAGGAAPKDARGLALRWIGYSHFEIVYNGQIILLDAYYDRGSM